VEGVAYRDWLTKEEAETYIGQNSPFYLDKWKTHSESRFKGWNWAAFFFGIQWMTYRRMYIEALLYYLLTVVVGIIIGLILGVFGIRIDGSLLRSILQLFVGIFGNAIYRNKALRVLRKSGYLDETGRLLVMQTKGGVSVVGVIVGVLLQVAIAVLLGFLVY